MGGDTASCRRHAPALPATASRRRQAGAAAAAGPLAAGSPAVPPQQQGAKQGYGRAGSPSTPHSNQCRPGRCAGPAPPLPPAPPRSARHPRPRLQRRRRARATTAAGVRPGLLGRPRPRRGHPCIAAPPPAGAPSPPRPSAPGASARPACEKERGRARGGQAWARARVGGQLQPSSKQASQHLSGAACAAPAGPCSRTVSPASGLGRPRACAPPRRQCPSTCGLAPPPATAAARPPRRSTCPGGRQGGARVCGRKEVRGQAPAPTQHPSEACHVHHHRHPPPGSVPRKTCKPRPKAHPTTKPHPTWPSSFPPGNCLRGTCACPQPTPT